MPFFFYDTEIGRIWIAEAEGAIARLGLPGEPPPENGEIRETPVLLRAGRELVEYLSGERRLFSVKSRPAGTPFMRRVWEALSEIPFGETASYGEIARRIGRPGAARAVGTACRKNPVPLIVPCHRAVGAGGRLAGYRGGLPLKERLLRLEREGKP
jgi:methylated-DNA-[protein]-cysteine S-methyltransferase